MRSLRTVTSLADVNRHPGDYPCSWFLQLPPLQKCLQDQHGRHLVDSSCPPRDAHFAGPEHSVGFYTRETLIPEMDRDLEVLLNEFRELSRPGGSRTIRSAKAEWQSDNYLAHIILFQDVGQVAQVGALVSTFESWQALCCYAQAVGDGEADSPGSEIDRQQPSRSLNRRFFQCGHHEIIVGHAG